MTAISSSLYSKWVIKSENYCHVDLSILDANGENFVRKYFHESIPFDLIGCDEFISRSRMKNVSNKLLFMDTLTILCRIEESDHDTEGCDCYVASPRKIRSQLREVEDLETFLYDNVCADF